MEEKLRNALTNEQVELIEQLFDEFLWSVPGGTDPYSLSVTDFELAEASKNMFLHWLKTGEVNSATFHE